MIRILAVELRRFAWRRSFRFFGLLVLAGIALAATIVFFTSHPGAESARMATESRQQMIDDCTNSFRRGEPPHGYQTAEEFCVDAGTPLVASLDPRFRLTTLTDIFGGTSVPLIILGLALGASFIGAEWHAGTITSLLTWQPRRVPVLMGKVLAAMTGVFLAALALQTVLGLALWFVAAVRGTTEGADLAWLGDTAAIAIRGAIIAGLAAALGFAIGSIARNTTTALIIGFVYFAVGESLLRGLKPAWQPWLIGDNAILFIVANPVEFTFAGAPRSTLGALMVVVGYAAAAVAMAAAWFQARDVT